MTATSDEQWLSTPAAEKASGVGRRQLVRLATSGVIGRQKTAGGAWQYSATDCEGYQASKDAGADADADTMLGQAYGLINTLVGPAKAFCELLQRENHSLRERNFQLESKIDDVLRAREELLCLKVDREMAVRHQEQVEERKERIFKLVENQVGPQLLSAVGSGGAAGAAKALMQSLDETQVQLLLDADLMSDEQKKNIRILIEASGGKLERESESA